MPTYDVAVVGTGIIGCSVAYALSRGSGSILLLDRGGLSSGASRASEGNLLACDRANDVELDLMTASQRRWQELNAELGGGFEYDQKGAILVARRTEDVDALERHAAWLAARDVGVEFVRGPGQELEPNLATSVAAVAHFPGDAQVQPMLACYRLARAFVGRGGTLRLYQPVARVVPKAGSIGLHLASGEVVDVGRVVIAAGVWTAELIAPFGAWIPVVPRRGHIAVLERGVEIRHKVLDFAYNSTLGADSSEERRVDVAAVIESTAAGAILCGSSRQFAGWDRSVDLPTVRRILAACSDLVPGLADLRVIRAYVGLRPFSPDGLPLIGWVTEDQRVAIATGHEGSGHGLAAVTGELIRSLLDGRVDAMLRRLEPLRFEHRGVAA